MPNLEVQMNTVHIIKSMIIRDFEKLLNPIKPKIKINTWTELKIFALKMFNISHKLA